MPLPASLKGAAWLADPDLLAVLDALEADGGEARVAGGAVRDGLLGRPVDDVDVATTEPPDRVLELVQAARLSSRPTGLPHGTVTVGSGGQSFEVTTLRVDVETYGRHAKVEFTDRWERDARRRDFTINALYCDRSGRVHDHVGGLADLEARRVRFVGDAPGRIEEDHLRILRFFRFHAQFGRGEPEAGALSACIAARGQLRNLSRQRIRQEFLKLLCAPLASATLRIMETHGILELVLAGERDRGRFERLAGLEDGLGLEADPVRRLAALAGAPATERLRDEFVLSNSETGRLDALEGLPRMTPAFRDAERRTLLYRHGSQAVIDRVLLDWSAAAAADRDPDWANLLETARSWHRPEFPVCGRDLLDAGIEEGEELGGRLRELEDWWVAGGFAADRAALMERLAATKR